MKTLLYLFTISMAFISCQTTSDKEAIKKEIFNAEKAFEKMVADEGIPEAFYFFADEQAVIKRENDTLIIGKEQIKSYYEQNAPLGATVNWTPDFIDVSDCGNMAYTYGKYVWRVKNEGGEERELKGVFHTVWKRQADKSWKYVWD
jgi:ketosteroid isomerase-like protein